MDAVSLLKRDHRTVDELFRRYEALGKDPERRAEIVHTIIRELSVHAAIEEQVLYPEVKDVLDEGDSMADEALEEHQRAKEVLADLDRMDPRDPNYDSKVRALIRDVRHHVEEEESEMLPQLASALPTGTLDELGERMQTAKEMAPTRPHPNAPSTPPSNIMAAPAAAVVDRARDAVSGRTDAARPKPKRKATTSKRSASKKKTATARSKTRSSTSARSRRPRTGKRPTSRQRATKGPVFHVRVDAKGGWRADKEGSSRAAIRSESKRDVVKRARDLAQTQHGRLVIHLQNGRIQEQRSYR